MGPSDSATDAWIFRLVQATQDAVITIDARGHIGLFNASAERMFGYTAQEVRGRNVSMLMPDPYRSEHDGYVSRYEKTGEARAIGCIRTVTAQRSNGETFPIELSVTEVAADEGTRYGAFIRDISEKVAMQRELVDRERLAAIGTTAAKFAHEVANPLNGMFTHAQLMQRRLKRTEGADERLGKSVQSLIRDIVRLNALLLEFRSMSRRQEYRMAPADLASLCREMADLESAELAERGATLELDFPDDLPSVSADAPKLKQVFLNLCKNAMEAMPDGGTIHVRGYPSGERVVIEIDDDGCGIPDNLDVFAPFATSKPAGTGLGLPIVREIVRAHDGQVSYRKRATQGTTFVVDLPAASG